MFNYLKGVLVDINYPYCTIDVGGIGYLIFTNNRTISSLPELNSEIKIYTKLIHKEDLMQLCGFINKQDRIIFDILTSVSGIGVKVAFSLLDEFDTNELIEAVIEENHKLISRTKGIGAKMAQKIVLEIKDKITKIDGSGELIKVNSKNSKISSSTITETTAILQSLGYNSKEYNSAIELAITKLEKDDSSELLKEVLRILSVF